TGVQTCAHPISVPEWISRVEYVLRIRYCCVRARPRQRVVAGFVVALSSGAEWRTSPERAACKERQSAHSYRGVRVDPAAGPAVRFDLSSQTGGVSRRL